MYNYNICRAKKKNLISPVDKVPLDIFSIYIFFKDLISYSWLHLKYLINRTDTKRKRLVTHIVFNLINYMFLIPHSL